MLMTIFAATTMLLSSPDTLFVGDTTSKYDSVVFLEDVHIEGNTKKEIQMSSSQNKVEVGKTYLENHFSGSLMQTLEEIPGVKAMSIGSGQSKPTIRGMGYNRMVVTENGIKHESQQWGDDHGLEIDQFSIDRVDIIKGPSTLLYGSDAIGGVLNLYTNYIPVDKLEGNITLFGRSGNETLGLAGKIASRGRHFFYRAGFSLTDYADYNVPTDSIQYYSYWIKLKDSRLRNTAGKEYNGNVMFGYIGNNFHTDLRISDNYSKSGFFANAHGMEVRLSDIDYDKSRRDIDLPYQQVNHLKIISHTAGSINKFDFEMNLAYQNNLREEHSEPLSHGYMPEPKNTLERQFKKNTYTANLQVSKDFTKKHKASIGFNTEYQQNEKDGWGFIIPDFKTFSFGTYLFDKYTVNENLIFNAGLRYDFAHTHIYEYFDWYKTPANNGDSLYKQRSEDIKRNFNSVTYSLGMIYNLNDWIFKANVGKSFRIPIAKELGADGINYHIFRYEKGNTELDAEQSYQLDFGINYSNNNVNIQFDPYLNYFPNYIYLDPSYLYREGLQLYSYTQAQVLRYGLEIQAVYRLNKYLETEISGEYLYSEQLSGKKKGYTLPFSTPWSADCGLKYTFDQRQEGFVSFNVRVVGRQDNIVPPEKATDGYWTLNASAGKHFSLGENTLKISLQAKNILNKRYYDHTSFYRLIDVPEQGCSISLMVALDF